MSDALPTINERLNQSVKQLKHLNTLESRKKNQVQQTKNDNDFQEVVRHISQLCYAVHYAQETFSLPYQPQAALIGILSDLQTTASKNTVTEDSILQSMIRVKPVQEQLKKEWTKHYQYLVKAVVSTLQIIQRIDPPTVAKCLTDIQSSAVWQNDGSELTRLKSLNSAMTNSSAIIERLGLDQKITTFLTKVSSRTATLNDLDDDILAWIQKENLSDRILISFK